MRIPSWRFLRNRLTLPGAAKGVAVLGLLLMTGCGFTPLYANSESDPAAAEMRAIRVNPILERPGHKLEMLLRNSLNPSGTPTERLYSLSVSLLVYRQNLGIQSTGTATRGQVDAYATYRLDNLKDGTLLVSNTIHSANAFEILDNEYASLVAEDDARDRIVAELNQEIMARLSFFLQRRAAEKTAKPAG